VIFRSFFQPYICLFVFSNLVFFLYHAMLGLSTFMSPSIGYAYFIAIILDYMTVKKHEIIPYQEKLKAFRIF
jgi:hypothetical protein